MFQADLLAGRTIVVVRPATVCNRFGFRYGFRFAHAMEHDAARRGQSAQQKGTEKDT